MTDQRYLFYSDEDLCCARDIAPHVVIINGHEWSAEPAQDSIDRGHDAWNPRPMTEAICGLRAYRDNLRNGWHVVPGGTRYVAVQGVKAGQYTVGPLMERWAREAAEDLNRPEHLRTFPAYVWGTRDTDRQGDWCVLDLHDLEDHHKGRLEATINVPSGGWASVTVTSGEPVTLPAGAYHPTDAFKAFNDAAHQAVEKPTPRFIVKSASEMKKGEPYVYLGKTATCQDYASWYNEQPLSRPSYRFVDAYGPSFIVDTHDEWHMKWMGRAEPTDAEIVELFDRTMRQCEQAGIFEQEMPRIRDGWLECGNTRASWADYQAARSREIKRRAAESRERERQRIVCEGTLPEDY